MYSTIESSNGYYDVNTSVTHPWIAVEQGTNHQMLLNSRQIYFPSPPEIPHAAMAQVFITPNGTGMIFAVTVIMSHELRGVNFGFWSHLGCSVQNAIIFSREGLV